MTNRRSRECSASFFFSFSFPLVPFFFFSTGNMSSHIQMAGANSLQTLTDLWGLMLRARKQKILPFRAVLHESVDRKTADSALRPRPH